MKTIATLPILVLLLCSCQPKDIGIQGPLIGNWQLVEEMSSGIAYVRVRIPPTDSNMIRFASGKQYSLIKRGTTVDVGTYALRIGKANYSKKKELQFVQTSNRKSPEGKPIIGVVTVYLLTADSLKIGYSYGTGGWGETYARKH